LVTYHVYLKREIQKSSGDRAINPIVNKLLALSN